MKQQWQANTYDNSMGFVSSFGQSLLEWLEPQENEEILDFGCGTGELAEIIAKSGAEVTGVDSSAEMIARARSKFPHLTFVHADCQHYTSKEPVDAVFSNAALHWMRDAKGTASSIAASLRPGGRFVAEFGGLGNIASIIEKLPAAFDAAGELEKLQLPWYFPSIGQYATLLEQSGMRVDTALCFDRPTKLAGGEGGLREWLGVFANVILRSLDSSKQEAVIQWLEQALRPTLFAEGTWTLDYRRIRIRAYKPL